MAASPENHTSGASRRPPASASDDCVSGAPLGDCSADEPANTLPAEPVSISRVTRPKEGTAPASRGAAGEDGTQTPARHREPDIPSDGPDPVGEAMIREVPDRKGSAKQDGKPGQASVRSDPSNRGTET